MPKRPTIKPPPIPARKIPRKKPVPTVVRPESDAPHLEDPWQRNTATVKLFLEQQEAFQQLASEVQYTLSRLLSKAKIKVAAVTSRAKTLESFLEKLERKEYGDPFTGITDFAGARIVCFYPDDIPKIEAIVNRNFEIVEVEDKKQAVDRFGYRATHFLVKLGSHVSGARYDDLKDRKCEIQVRTVLQDAWAIFSHHLMYKHEADIPDPVKREINALAGTFETADNTFQAIREKRDAYSKSIKASTKANNLTGVATNLDSVKSYLIERFPRLKTPGSMSWELAYDMIPLDVYPTLEQIDQLIKRTEIARQHVSAHYGPPTFQTSPLVTAIRLAHPRQNSTQVDFRMMKALQNAQSLVSAE